jgi:hypothetical protein
MLCWGYWKHICTYSAGRDVYDVKSLVFDTFPGSTWWPEAFTVGEFSFKGKTHKFSSTFRHSKCPKVSRSGQPFANFMCASCMRIPQEHDFRMRVKQEEGCIFKRGSRTTGGGRRLGYLQAVELTGHGWQLNMRFRELRAAHWGQK